MANTSNYADSIPNDPIYKPPLSLTPKKKDPLEGIGDWLKNHGFAPVTLYREGTDVTKGEMAKNAIVSTIRGFPKKVSTAAHVAGFLAPPLGAAYAITTVAADGIIAVATGIAAGVKNTWAAHKARNEQLSLQHPLVDFFYEQPLNNKSGAQLNKAIENFKKGLANITLTADNKTLEKFISYFHPIDENGAVTTAGLARSGLEEHEAPLSGQLALALKDRKSHSSGTILENFVDDNVKSLSFHYANLLNALRNHAITSDKTKDDESFQNAIEQFFAEIDKERRLENEIAIPPAKTTSDLYHDNTSGFKELFDPLLKPLHEAHEQYQKHMEATNNDPTVFGKDQAYKDKIHQQRAYDAIYTAKLFRHLDIFGKGVDRKGIYIKDKNGKQVDYSEVFQEKFNNAFASKNYKEATAEALRETFQTMKNSGQDAFSFTVANVDIKWTIGDNGGMGAMIDLAGGMWGTKDAWQRVAAYDAVIDMLKAQGDNTIYINADNPKLTQEFRLQAIKKGMDISKDKTHATTLITDTEGKPLESKEDLKQLEVIVWSAEVLTEKQLVEMGLDPKKAISGKAAIFEKFHHIDEIDLAQHAQNLRNETQMASKALASCLVRLDQLDAIQHLTPPQTEEREKVVEDIRKIELTLRDLIVEISDEKKELEGIQAGVPKEKRTGSSVVEVKRLADVITALGECNKAQGKGYKTFHEEVKAYMSAKNITSYRTEITASPSAPAA